MSEDILKKVKGWPGYVDAKYGFRNHWYPVMFSKDIAEGEVKKIKLLGEPLLVKRIDGKLHWAVAGAECNTVIELKPEHHAALPWSFA
ncbi:Rieske 2Fe-2S domain-containing protein [Stutzerimonas stutzeri]|uniref:Rieske 2Fe-2S domain-containing protein n=1 Tax=Stutzerimonas stutzeri TaxID=316 RepID=UPI001ED951E2|nr:Rieske 2Fe-2S domain-containing protein [Stutzerimonas stutzeri]